jgi:hypothetical protein
MGLVINSTTGVIDVSASTAGTYTVTYSVTGTGAVSRTITINSTPTATITGATSYCAGTGGTTLIANGSQLGDTFSWLKNDSPTGLTTQNIYNQTAGIYQVIITRGNTGDSACVDSSSFHTVTEIPSQNTNFNYQNSSYAQDGTDPTPVATTSGGTFTASPSGLSINSSTGKIDLSASSVNTYTITYSLPAPCPSTTSRTVGITAAAYSSVYSVALDGVNDYLQENYYNALSGQNYFTISLWFYIQFPSSYETSSNTAFQPFITAWTNPYLYIVRLNGTNIQFYQRTNTNQTVLTQGSVGTLEHNRWYHVVAIKNGSTNTVYLDGVLKATNTSAASMKSANIGARIGLYGAANGSFLVDEVTQYTTAFTSANVTSQYNNGVPTSPIGSPVNWWKMGEDSAGNANTIANDGSGINILTRTNGASFRVEPAGIFNQRSIDFDGTNDFVTFGDSNNWSFTGEEEDSPLSISAWIKADTTTGGILGKYGSTGYEWLFYLINGQIRFIIRNSQQGLPYRLVHTSATISTNTWTHVAVTYNGQYFNNDFGMKIYKNGSEITNLTKGNSGNFFGMINYSTPMTLGSASGGTFFNGKIDECALFNYTLSSSAITEIYNSGSPQIDLNNLSNATTDPIMWARGGDRDTFSTLTNRGSLNINGTYTNMSIDDINFDVKT